MKRLIIVALAAGAFAASCDRQPAAAPSMPAQPSPKPAQPAAPKAPTPDPAPAAGASQVTALGLTFTIPEGWKSVPPANPMRLAELRIPDPAGDSDKDCLAVFSTAGGEVQANIDRWTGQVRDSSGDAAAANVSRRTIDGMTVHAVELTGAFSPGMGDTRVLQGWMLRGTIIETGGGLLFIKMTGPAVRMNDLSGAFQAMVDGLKRR